MREISYHICSTLYQQQVLIQQRITRSNDEFRKSRKKKRNESSTDIGIINKIWKIRVELVNCKNKTELIHWISNSYYSHLTDTCSHSLQTALLNTNKRICDCLPDITELTSSERLELQQSLITEIDTPGTPVLSEEVSEHENYEHEQSGRTLKRAKSQSCINL